MNISFGPVRLHVGFTWLVHLGAVGAGERELDGHILLLHTDHSLPACPWNLGCSFLCPDQNRCLL